MAELFNPEQYHQQMSGQAPQGQAMQGQMPATQGQAHMMQPQPYQPIQPAQPYAQSVPPQAWAPQHQQMQQPHVMQPQTPVHHMPAPPIFAPPPGTGISEEVEDTAKKPRSKRKREPKVKTPKVKKAKADTAKAVHTTKTSPAIIFMFGMATGIVAFLVGNMAMSALLSDNSAKSFKEIERQNAQMQQPVLPKSAANIDGEAATAMP